MTKNKFTKLLIPCFLSGQEFEKQRKELAAFFYLENPSDTQLKAALEYKLKDVKLEEIASYFYDAEDFVNGEYTGGDELLIYNYDLKFFIGLFFDEYCEFCTENGFDISDKLSFNSLIVRKLEEIH